MPAQTPAQARGSANETGSLRAIIIGLLGEYEPADVPGYARQRHGIIITQAAVRDIFRGLNPGVRASPPPKDPPADFVANASAEYNEALAFRYSVGINTITRWRRETATRAPIPSRGQPMPQGFPSVAAVMSNKHLEARYSVGAETVKRWRAECGVPLPPRSPKLLPFKQNAFQTAPVDRPHRDDSIAGQAADFLRRLGPVIRCDRSGRYDQNGDRWRRGSTLLTADEVIERAVRNGWRRDEWRRVA